MGDRLYEIIYATIFFNERTGIALGKSEKEAIDLLGKEYFDKKHSY